MSVFKLKLAATNAFGRQYINGLPMSDDFRRLIITEIKENGASASCLPSGLITKVSLKFKTARLTIRKIWLQFLDVGSPTRKQFSRISKPKKLKDQDLAFIIKN